MNGYSNRFWGWGAEDDDARRRVHAAGYRLARAPAQVLYYKMLTHHPQRKSRERVKKLRLARRSRWQLREGLSSLHYQTLQRKRYPLYTLVRVSIKPEK